MEEENKKNNKTKKKSSKTKKIIIGIVILLIICVAAIAGVAYYKLSQINLEHIDKEDLEVNNELYSEVADKVSEKEFKDIVTIALFGSDSRDVNNASSGRSDCIMIASVNPVKKTIKLISIPRDSYVYVPYQKGWWNGGYTKINHAYAYGGEQLTIKTINSNFGLNITEYVTIDFSGLINVINAVGGIEMDITKAERDVLNDYLVESCRIAGKPYVPMTEYGHVTLNGEQALAHSRNRYVGSDFDRASRQRDVLMALMDKMSSMNSSTIMSLVSDTFLSQVKTNVNVTDYIGLMTDVLSNKDSYLNNIISAQVPSTDYAYDKHIDGIYYLGFDLELAKQDLYSYIYEK